MRQGPRVPPPISDFPGKVLSAACTFVAGLSPRTKSAGSFYWRGSTLFDFARRAIRFAARFQGSNSLSRTSLTPLFFNRSSPALHLFSVAPGIAPAVRQSTMRPITLFCGFRPVTYSKYTQ